SYRVLARDAASNQSGYSNTAIATTQAPSDTQPPTAPSGLTATPISGSQINLVWTGPSDHVGVAVYSRERCQGVGCSSFAQIGTPTGTTSNDTGLTPSATYSYRVLARDAANNPSGYSNTATADTPAAPPAPLAFKQQSYAVPQSPVATVSSTFAAA